MRKRVLSLIRFRSNLDALIVGAGLILFWRGIWGLMDLYFFPDNQVLSFAASALIGLAVLYFDDFQLQEIHTEGPHTASVEAEPTNSDAK